MIETRMDSEAQPRGYWAEARATLSLAAPMIMTMVAIILMESIDTLMIGRLGEVALASAALGIQAWFLFLLFGLGVLGAVSSLTAQAVAAKDDRGVRRSTRQGLWVGLMIGTPSALLLTQADQVFLAIGQDPVVVEGAQSYLNWMGMALIFIFLTPPLRLTMASYGVTLPMMIFTWLAVPVNALLNWVFMYGVLGAPEMGIAGAGLSTMLVDAGLVLACVIYIQRTERFARLKIFSNFWRPDWPRFWQLLRIGIPAGASQVFEHGLFFATAMMMGWIGVTQLAAHQIALQWVSIIFMFPLGMSQAATIRIGLAGGMRDLESVRRRGWIIFQITGVGMLLSAVLFWTMGPNLAAIFIASDDPSRGDLIHFGALFLAIAAIFQLVDGTQNVGGGVLRGINDAVVPMVSAFVGYWVLGIPIAYLLAFHVGLGGVGIWYGMAVGLAACAIGAVARFWWLIRSPQSAFARITSN